MRLQDKTTIVVGAGQTPGETVGNGRATAIRFAREGANVVVVDKDEASAAETVTMIKKEGGVAFVLALTSQTRRNVKLLQKSALSATAASTSCTTTSVARKGIVRPQSLKPPRGTNSCT